jgi:hypothetical protein
MAVMIGVDPHKGSHTAVALDQLRRRSAERSTSSKVTGR